MQSYSADGNAICCLQKVHALTLSLFCLIISFFFEVMQFLCHVICVRLELLAIHGRIYSGSGFNFIKLYV
jgi:hypothetical protein